MYTYEPLEDPESEIRLAILQPGAFADPICITFQFHTLENNSLDYEALSYAWGSSDDPSVVHIESDDQPPLSITRNLDVALRHLRYEACCRTMWVDALCIDQNSIHEKNHQVAFMGEIYASAVCVVIWLGTKQADSDRALDIIEHVSSCIDVDLYAGILQPSEHCAESEKHFGDVSVILPFENAALDPVVHLIERPYFKRIWIRQEFAFANHGVLYCGDRQLDMQDFRKAMLYLFLKATGTSPVSASLHPSFVSARTRLYYLSNALPGTSSWASIKYLIGDAQCQDPRDRIYALLAFLNKSEPVHDLRPDYSITTEQLYTHVASRTITEQSSLELLELCDLGSRRRNIPSWVPDWSSPMTQATRATHWSACGWISSKCSIIDEKLLKIIGIIISHIDEVIEIALPFKMNSERVCKTISRILRTLEPSEEDLESRGWTKRRWAEMLSTIATGSEFQESYYPPDESRLKTKSSMLSKRSVLQTSRLPSCSQGRILNWNEL